MNNEFVEEQIKAQEEQVIDRFEDQRFDTQVDDIDGWE